MLACSLQLRTKNTCVLTNAAARCDVLGDYRCGSERACVDEYSRCDVLGGCRCGSERACVDERSRCDVLVLSTHSRHES